MVKLIWCTNKILLLNRNPGMTMHYNKTTVLNNGASVQGIFAIFVVCISADRLVWNSYFGPDSLPAPVLFSIVSIYFRHDKSVWEF